MHGRGPVAQSARERGRWASTSRMISSTSGSRTPSARRFRSSPAISLRDMVRERLCR